MTLKPRYSDWNRPALVHPRRAVMSKPVCYSTGTPPAATVAAMVCREQLVGGARIAGMETVRAFGSGAHSISSLDLFRRVT